MSPWTKNLTSHQHHHNNWFNCNLARTTKIQSKNGARMLKTTNIKIFKHLRAVSFAISSGTLSDFELISDIMVVLAFAKNEDLIGQEWPRVFTTLNFTNT